MLRLSGLLDIHSLHVPRFEDRSARADDETPVVAAEIAEILPETAAADATKDKTGNRSLRRILFVYNNQLAYRSMLCAN